MVEIYPIIKKKAGCIINYEISHDFDGVFNDFYNILKQQKHINWDFYFLSSE